MQKLRAIHLVDQGAYLIERGYYGVELEVDGLAAPANGLFVVQSLDHILHVKRSRGELLNYRDADGNTIPVAQYNTEVQRLRQDARLDDDGEWDFPSLDAEFDYRKFHARWSEGDRAPDVVTKSPVEAEVVEVRTESGDTDIVSLWNAPHVKRDASLYSFERDPFMVRLCRQLCAEAGLALDLNRTIGGAEWDYLRFAKIEGEYAFDTTFDASKGPFIGTLADCKAEKERCRERVASIVRVRAIKKAGKALPNAGEVILALRDIQRRLAGVHTTTKSAEDMRFARKRIADLAASIEGGA